MLGRVVLSLSCGEHHSLAIATAPITADGRSSAAAPRVAASGGRGGVPPPVLCGLSSDMQVWFAMEERERALKLKLAAESAHGVGRREWSRVLAARARLQQDHDDHCALSDQIFTPKGGEGGERPPL